MRMIYFALSALPFLLRFFLCFPLYFPLPLKMLCNCGNKVSKFPHISAKFGSVRKISHIWKMEVAPQIG